MAPVEIFFSYSHKDEKLRDELAKHLGFLKEKGVISDWHDREISGGTVVADEIKTRLNSAHVILLLISVDFIDSKYCSGDKLEKAELEQAMKRHEAKEARVIPVLLRECNWKDTPFGHLEPLPKDRRFIDSWENKDKAFTEVAKGIQQVVKEISRQKILDDTTKPFITKLFWLIPWSSLFKTFSSSGGVTLIVLIIRLFSGIFEPSELWFYDQMMRFQFKENPDERLLLVEVTPDDIQTYGRGSSQKQNQSGSSKQSQNVPDNNIPRYGASLPDGVIYRLLNTLLEKKATVIGLDIYRDFEAYDENLKNLFKEENINKRLIFICKIPDVSENNKGYDPPPDIPEEQVGFSDFLVDNAGIIRRQLLRMKAEKDNNSKCGVGSKEKNEFMDSFAFKVAQKYLEITTSKKFEAQDIGSELNYNNKISFDFLDYTKQGGYSLLQNFNGFQILLNYRYVKNPGNNSYAIPIKDSTNNIAKRVSVKDILRKENDKNDDIAQKLVEGKIILVGVPSESYDTISPTPFSADGVDSQMWGLYIQAQKVSQIVSAALDKRPLLQVWSLEAEILWIISWAAIGAILVQLYKEPRKLIMVAGFCILILSISCLGLFIFPTKIWIPFTPTVVAFFCSGGILFIIELQSQKTQKRLDSR